MADLAGGIFLGALSGAADFAVLFEGDGDIFFFTAAFFGFRLTGFPMSKVLNPVGETLRCHLPECNCDYVYLS